MGTKKIIIGLLAGILLMFGCVIAFGQTTTQKFTVDRIYKADSIIVTNTKAVHDTVIIYPDTAAILALKCSTVVQPPAVTILQSIYVVLDDVISDMTGNISYWKSQGVNEVNLYARSYITTSSKRSKLSDVISKLHGSGIKVNIDYRLTSELPSWEAYFNTYPNSINRPDGMITEREPYVTGDYTGFYPFLREGKTVAKKLGIGLYCYMGHPTTQAWDSIVFYCDRVYLSNYISMSTYNGANGQWRYVAGRVGYISDAAKKQGKVDYKFCYIKSLEKKSWGAGNDFMGDAYIGKTFYGPIMTQGLEQYESNATSEQKKYTELIGDCIFHHKYAVLAIPK